MSYVSNTLVASDVVQMLEYDRMDISEGIDIKKNKRIKRVQNLSLLVL